MPGYVWEVNVNVDDYAEAGGGSFSDGLFATKQLALAHAYKQNEIADACRKGDYSSIERTEDMDELEFEWEIELLKKSRFSVTEREVQE